MIGKLSIVIVTGAGEHNGFEPVKAKILSKRVTWDGGDGGYLLI